MFNSKSKNKKFPMSPSSYAKNKSGDGMTDSAKTNKTKSREPMIIIDHYRDDNSMNSNPGPVGK